MKKVLLGVFITASISYLYNKLVNYQKEKEKSKYITISDWKRWKNNHEVKPWER